VIDPLEEHDIKKTVTDEAKLLKRMFLRLKRKVNYLFVIIIFKLNFIINMSVGYPLVAPLLTESLLTARFQSGTSTSIFE
jgi:hypothetical protein